MSCEEVNDSVSADCEHTKDQLKVKVITNIPIVQRMMGDLEIFGKQYDSQCRLKPTERSEKTDASFFLKISFVSFCNETFTQGTVGGDCARNVGKWPYHR